VGNFAKCVYGAAFFFAAFPASQLWGCGTHVGLAVGVGRYVCQDGCVKLFFIFIMGICGNVERLTRNKMVLRGRGNESYVGERSSLIATEDRVITDGALIIY
jgi:hypothetical protein